MTLATEVNDDNAAEGFAGMSAGGSAGDAVDDDVNVSAGDSTDEPTDISLVVSAIIPTYNRRDLVRRAIDSVLAQTEPPEEIVVVDDGSTDGTEDALRAAYGTRIRYLWQPNAGVSAARNAGMAAARGRYIALLDSDDTWLPEKTALQRAWLDARPDFGMVLCDVVRVDADGTPYDTFFRREVLREDGWALRYLLLNPSLVPASAMFRREVFARIGGFDTSLRTAEDIDFHLRAAKHFRIGTIEAPLAHAMRGHDGLSAESSTYDDYVRVVERAVADCAGEVDDAIRHRALAVTYARNARGMVIRGRWRDAVRLARASWSHAQDGAQKRELLGLAPFAAKRAVRRLLP